MEKTKRKTVRIAVAILALLLVSSALAVFSNFTNTTVAATDYGDIMQYTWPQSGHDSGNTRFSPGPGPNRPDVLWTARNPTGGSISGGPGAVAFDGKIICYGGGRVFALDPFTGSLIWNQPANVTPAGFGTGSYFRIDNTYFGCVSGSGVGVFKTETGEFVARYDINSTRDGIIASHTPGSIMYWVSFYDIEDKMAIACTRNNTTNEPLAIAWDFSTPLSPKIKWTTVLPTGPEAMGSGGGLVFWGGYGEGEIYALNATTGAIVWKNWKVGNVGYCVTVYDNKVIHAESSTRVTAYDLHNGTLLWDYDNGARAFFAFGGAAAYGRYFDKSMLPGLGDAAAWDVETGELLWRIKAHYTITYQTPAVADGKMYVSLSDQGPGSQVAGVFSPGYRFAAIDVYTGTILWEIPHNFAIPIVAYGNVYGLEGGTLYCIGESTREWPMWCNGPDNRGVAIGGHAPADISKAKWAYKTDGPISGSPVAADGKVFFGSYDQYYYALDADNGSLIWKFKTNDRIRSTPAVVGGKVYTGADDSYIYCINANTGVQVWKTYAGKQSLVLYQPTWQPRSSPIVVGDRVYVGSMDGNLYALDLNGVVKWKATITNSSFGIGGSPCYANNTVYIAGADGYLNAVNAADGTLKWKTTQVTNQVGPAALVGTPMVVRDMAFIARNVFMGGQELRAYNITNGSYLFNASLTKASAAGSMSPAVFTPTFKAGAQVEIKNGTNIGENAIPRSVFDYNNTIVRNYPTIYTIEGMYLSAWCILYPGDTVYNGTSLSATPNQFRWIANSTYMFRAWYQWLGRQTFSTPILADDVGGWKLYFGSDVYTVFCMNATSGATLSVFEPAGQTFDTPAIYEGRMYIGSEDTYMYCFEETRTAPFSLTAWTDKGAKMWSNETIKITGKLTPTETTEHYGSMAANGLPNASVQVSLTKPDMSSVNLTTTTDNNGFFSVSYSPTQVGNWGWVAWYQGKQMPILTYEAAYTEWNPFEVTATTPVTSPTPSPSPTPAPGTPVEYIYAAIAVIVIVIIAIGAYVFTRRSKK